MNFEETYAPLFKDIKGICEGYGYEITIDEDSFYIYEIIKDKYVKHIEGISIREFPSNCAWLIVHSFNDMNKFDSWFGLCKEISAIGQYAGILFSLNDNQLQYAPNLDGCIKLVSQYNPHSFGGVHLFLFPLTKVE